MDDLDGLIERIEQVTAEPPSGAAESQPCCSTRTRTGSETISWTRPLGRRILGGGGLQGRHRYSPAGLRAKERHEVNSLPS